MTTDTLIGGLFMAGVVPGLKMAGIVVACAMLPVARCHRHIQRGARASLPEALAAVRRSLWALSLPLFVVGGM